MLALRLHVSSLWVFLPILVILKKMDVKIGATCSFSSFNTLPCILSGLHALCGFRLHRSFDTPADDMFICGILEWGL
jgi:hypothetical protein